MRKVTILFISMFCLVSAFTADQAFAREPETSAVSGQEAAQPDRVEGTIQRFSKENFTIDVRETKTKAVKVVVWNEKTAWTQRNQPGDISPLKDNVRVICLGKYDDKGRLLASRIDFR